MYNMEFSFLGYKLRVELLILIGVVYLIMVAHTLSSCCNVSGFLEGFTGANTNYNQSGKFSLNNYKPTDTSKWNMPDLVVTPGMPLGTGVQNILNRPEQPIPLPEGELSMFANTEFKPECCPNTYSNSTGCACMTTKQYNYLVTRGSNNIPYSEF
jgi:hypothetical protein